MTLDILGYSVTPYHTDNQYVTKTILYSPGLPTFLGFYVYTLDYQHFTVYYLTFSTHVLY